MNDVNGTLVHSKSFLLDFLLLGKRTAMLVHYLLPRVKSGRVALSGDPTDDDTYVRLCAWTFSTIIILNVR